MKKWVAALACGSCLSVGAAAQEAARITIPGQGQGTITFFDRQNYGGAAITYRQGEPRVRLPFTMGSIRTSGSWRVCEGINFTGRCTQVSRDLPNARSLGLSVVGSLQPLSGGGAGNLTGRVSGPTLRGYDAQFWSLPEVGGQKVRACAGPDYPGCAQQNADRFCAYAGWRRASHFEQRRTGLFIHLADVLCTRR